MGLSAREYAEYRKKNGLPGGSRQGVNKAAREGRISREPDGTFDPVKCDAQWGANSDIPSYTSNKPAENNPKSEEEVSPIEEPVSVVKTTQSNGLNKARAAKISAEAMQAKLKLEKERGKLVDKKTIEDEVFSFIRMVRDQVKNFPTRYGPLIAGEFNLEARDVINELDRHINELLQDLSKRETMDKD